MKKIFNYLLSTILLISILTGCSLTFNKDSKVSNITVKSENTPSVSGKTSSVEETEREPEKEVTSSGDITDISETGSYTSRDEIAEYLTKYNKLPTNFVTKNEAKAAGWDSRTNYLSDVLPGKSIGGDRFGNYEKSLPVKKGRTYYEADVDYEGGKRNAKRIVFSNDGLIYYTADHYKTFDLLQGGE